MKISLVIPVYNAERTLNRCLECLSRQAYEDFEVILVDNNSTDASADIATRFLAAQADSRFRLIAEKRQGACAARNTGAAAATGDVIANMDPDCLATPEFLTELAAYFERPEVAAVAGNIAAVPPDSLAEEFAALFTLLGRREEQWYTRYDLVSGGFATANLAIRKDWFDRLGGFAEDVNYKGTGIGEDHDLLARLYREGGKLLAVPGATIEHWHRSSARGVIRQGFLFGLAHALLLSRYGKGHTLLEFSRFHPTFRTPFSGWLSLNTADKRLALLLVPAFFLGPEWLLLPAAYAGILVAGVQRRAHRAGRDAGLTRATGLFGLLVLKSAAMTTGRLRGSLMFRVVCI